MLHCVRKKTKMTSKRLDCLEVLTQIKVNNCFWNMSHKQGTSCYFCLETAMELSTVGLTWFQRGTIKLDEDLKFSEKVQKSVPIEWRSTKTIDCSVFTVFSRSWRKMHWLKRGVLKNSWESVEFWFLTWLTIRLGEGEKHFYVNMRIIGTIRSSLPIISN